MSVVLSWVTGKRLVLGAVRMGYTEGCVCCQLSMLVRISLPFHVAAECYLKRLGVGAVGVAPCDACRAV